MQANVFLLFLDRILQMRPYVMMLSDIVFFCKSLFSFLFVLTTCHREIYSNACLILFNSKNTLTLTLTQKNSIVQFFV